MISDSANTVQVVVMRTGFFERSASVPSSDSGSSSAYDAAPRKRPVPAAHLSFIVKSSTWRSGFTEIAFVSCPPMSMTVRVFGKSETAPFAWQVISVTCSWPNLTLYRP